jgi:hypothetical protein
VHARVVRDAGWIEATCQLIPSDQEVHPDVKPGEHMLVAVTRMSWTDDACESDPSAQVHRAQMAATASRVAFGLYRARGITQPNSSPCNGPTRWQRFLLRLIGGLGVVRAGIRRILG